MLGGRMDICLVCGYLSLGFRWEVRWCNKYGSYYNLGKKVNSLKWFGEKIVWEGLRLSFDIGGEVVKRRWEGAKVVGGKLRECILDVSVVGSF